MTDRSYITEVQYADDTNLRRRQSIYRFQQPRIDLYRWALGLAALDGSELVLDVGCGNGGYLATLAGDDHAGPLLGLDLSPGMATAAAAACPTAAVAVGDAAALPVRTESVDVALAMHMLYHVPDRPAAVRELRRVVRPGGTALVVTNALGHLAELESLLGHEYARSFTAFSMETGGDVLRTAFAEVERHDVTAELVVTDSAAVREYASSLRSYIWPAAGVDVEVRLDEVESAVADRIERDGAFRIRTVSGCFVCR